MVNEEVVFSSFLFNRYILPFLLIFTLFFAILEKTKILGEENKQINAIISLVIGLIVIAFPYPTGVVVKLMPFLAVAAIVILVFMLLYGFVATGGKEGFAMNKGLKIAFGIIIGVSLIIAVLWATGAWDIVYESLVEGDLSGTIWVNALFIALIVGAIAVVLASGKSSSSGSST